MPLTNENIASLNHNYPWPLRKPDFKPAEWPVDGGGKQLITKRIQGNQFFLIIEIGAFLGGSLKVWLETSPNVYVIAIDPWEGKWWEEYARANGRNSLAEQFALNDGPYLTFLSSLWDYKNRLFPVRGYSPEKLYELANLGIKPDLIYFDSDKMGGDIEVAHQLFPDAIISGDDWTWGMEQNYPIRKAVNKFIKDKEFKIVSRRATWVLVKSPIKLNEKLYTAVNFLRDIKRKLIHKKV